VDMLRSAWSWRGDYAVSHVDVFSGPAFLWAAAATWLLRRMGKPYVLSLRGGRLPDFARRWPRLVRPVLGSAKAVTVPSGYLLREMRPHRADLELLPNPLDLTAYPFENRAAPRPRLMWLRAFADTYNPVLAVRVLHRLSAKFPEATLTMIGPDKGDGSLGRTKATGAELGVSDRLRIIPGVFKEKVGEALSEGDIFLNTSNVDNAPVTVMEAMACGLPVVSTNVGGIPDLVSGDETALLVAPNDPDAMAAAVTRLVDEPGLAGRLTAHARRTAQRFDWAYVLPQWESLLRRVSAAASPARRRVAKEGIPLSR
jgi:glycosyltransferase involved in cell wall biosynthesis